MDDNVFYCNNRNLANYLKKNGSKFIKVDKVDGSIVYLFEKDDSIDRNLTEWEARIKKCLF